MIEIEDVSKTFHLKEQDIHALKHVNLTIEDGIIFGVIGYSGSGKSTLIRCINRLEKADSGHIRVNGMDITAMPEKELQQQRKKIGMIFQHFNLLKNDTVYQNVARPLLYAGKSRRETQEKVQELLSLVGLQERSDSYPSQLSGGQKQRVAIARALATEPEILLCDEATSALDPESTQSVLQLLKELNEKLHLTILLITHQMEVIRTVCSRVAVLNDGEIIDTGEPARLFTTSQNRITRQFADSIFQTNQVTEILTNDVVRKTITERGKIARLLYSGKSTDKALISETAKRFDVEINIIYGNIILFTSGPVGNLYIAIRGSVEQIEKAMRYIAGQNVICQIVSADGREAEA